jgi:hypothetical protein
MHRSRTRELLLTGLWSALSLLSSCTELENGGDLVPSVAAGASGSGSGSGGSSDAGSGGSQAGKGAVDDPGGSAGAGGEPSSDECPPLDERTPVHLPEVAGEEFVIDRDMTFDCQHLYTLEDTLVVGYGVTLTIEPGTVLLGNTGALLLVERGGQLDARGTKQQPIVFTSAKPAGERAAGDFRGIVLIGDGPTHTTNVPVYGTLDDARAHYGGGPAGSPGASCGTLRYVRVEFAGGNLDEEDQPGSALTLAGCGRGTEVDYVQVHRGTDGLGLFGGTVDVRHVVVSRNAVGNAIEWTAGYTGSLQFVVAQSLGASAAIQGNNSESDPEREPRSAPLIYNASVVGSAPLVSGEHFGVMLEHGSFGTLRNSIVTGFADAAFDLRLPEEVLANELGVGKAVDISHVLLFENQVDYSAAAQKLGESPGMRSDDPGLSRAAVGEDPSFVPEEAAVLVDVAAAAVNLEMAGFRGALDYEGEDWTAGWTAYPTD